MEFEICNLELPLGSAGRDSPASNKWGSGGDQGPGANNLFCHDPSGQWTMIHAGSALHPVRVGFHPLSWLW